MKVVLNRVTSYEGRPLKIGDIADIPLNISQRWINKGIAHVPERVSEIKPVEVKEPEVIEETEVIKETEESIIFREPEEIESEIVETESDFEPLPEVTEENIDELKTYKPKRKRNKKIDNMI